MSKLLTELEVSDIIRKIIGDDNYFQTSQPHDINELIESQKIAYADVVIGNQHELSEDGLRKSDGATMNNLIMEQRARNK